MIIANYLGIKLQPNIYLNRKAVTVELWNDNKNHAEYMKLRSISLFEISRDTGINYV